MNQDFLSESCKFLEYCYSALRIIKTLKEYLPSQIFQAIPLLQRIYFQPFEENLINQIRRKCLKADFQLSMRKKWSLIIQGLEEYPKRTNVFLYRACSYSYWNIILIFICGLIFISQVVLMFELIVFGVAFLFGGSILKQY